MILRLSLLIAAHALAAVAIAAEPPLPSDVADLQRRIDAGSPTARAALLTDFAERMEAVDPLRGIPSAREAIALAANPREKLAAEAALCVLLRYQADFASARALAQSGLERATALNDERLRARFCYELARTCWSQADHAEALKWYHEAIQVGERIGDAGVLADAHIGSHIAWAEFDEHELASAHLKLAGTYAEKSGDPRRLAAYYRTVGVYRQNTKDPAGARAAHERSRAISTGAGQHRGVADALHNLAAIAESDGQLETARTMMVEAIATYDRLNLTRYRANAYCTMGRLLAKIGRHPEALEILDRALTLARDTGARAALANCYRQLAFAHKAAGHAAQAADYQLKLDAETNTIFGERSRQKIALLKADFEIERQQLQLALLRRDQTAREDELRRAGLLRYALLALGALGVVTAAAVVSRQRVKLAAERRIVGETRAAQQAAEEADRLKTRLLGIASHDLRSPLSAIIACGKELERRPHDAAAAAEYGALVRRGGEQMLAFVRELLDLSAIESGRLKLSRAACDLAALASQCVEVHRLAAAAKDQTLNGEFPVNGEIIVFGDAARLAQVFDNLIGNAVKFTPRGGAIEVRADATGDRATVRVRDGGPGLAPEDFARLFQPFQTLSAQPTGGEGSTGLGLFIAREIVTLHGGTLGVDSVPGEGATFVVELPLFREAAERRAEIGEQDRAGLV